jgi:hypothetical protein
MGHVRNLSDIIGPDCAFVAAGASYWYPPARTEAWGLGFVLLVRLGPLIEFLLQKSLRFLGEFAGHGYNMSKVP